MALTACSSDDYSYTVGEKSPGAYLTTAKSTYVFTPGQEQVLTLGVGRTEYAEAETVTLSGDNPAFEVPTSVSFAAGEKEKTLSIPFALETGETASLKVSVTSATSQYAASSVALTVKCDYEWVSLGKGKYYDLFLFEEAQEVEILQCTGIPNMYRIVDPYTDAPFQDGIDVLYDQSSEIDITIYGKDDTFAGQTIGYDGLVGYDDIHTGTDVGYDVEVVVYHPGAGFKNHDTPDTWSYNKVLVYQDVESNGVKLPGQVQIAPYYYMDGVGGWNYADANASDGGIIITFPGYNPKDYEINIAYMGRLTDAKENDYVQANISFGADVESVKYALVTKDQVEATIAGIADGSIEAEELTAAGTVNIAAEESGTYYLVVVAFAGGEAVANDAVKIVFSASGDVKEKWTALYIGTYAYTTKDYTDRYGGVWDGEIEAVLYQSESDATRYKIAPWADLTGEDGLVFTMDSEGTLVVDEVYTGYTDDTYGEVFATDFVTGEVDEIPSTYDDGVFTFNLMYHDAEDAWAYVQDTFTITGKVSEARASSMKISQRGSSAKGKRGVKVARHYRVPFAFLRSSK